MWYGSSDIIITHLHHLKRDPPKIIPFLFAIPAVLRIQLNYSKQVKNHLRD